MEAMKIQCFERKPRVWIGPGREAEDIMIPEMACSLLLLRGQFLAKWEAEAEGKNSGGEVLLNGRRIEDGQGSLSEGDELQIYTEDSGIPVKISLFEGSLEIEGPEGMYQSSLLPVRPQGE